MSTMRLALQIFLPPYLINLFCFVFCFIRNDFSLPSLSQWQFGVVATLYEKYFLLLSFFLSLWVLFSFFPFFFSPVHQAAEAATYEDQYTQPLM